MYTTGSNRFLGTISEQRRHSRTAICGNRPTGRAVLRSTFNWPTAKLGERLPVSREGLASSISPSSPSSSCCSSSSVHFSPRSCSSYIRLCAERLSRGKQSNGKTFRFSLTFRRANASVYLYIVASRFNIFSRGRPRAEVKICKRFRGFDSVFSNRFTFEG